MSKWSSAYRDTRWQHKRSSIMERDGYKCVDCGASGEGVLINVHHAYYEAGKAPWEYADDTLICLCGDCHTHRHETQRSMNWMVGQLRGREALDAMKLAFDMIASGVYRRTSSDIVAQQAYEGGDQ